MKTDKEFQKSPAKGVEPNVTQLSPLAALRVAAHRLADTRRKPKLKTRDLVGLLLSHSARAWRNSMPRVGVRVSVNMPNGVPALRISCPVPTIKI